MSKVTNYSFVFPLSRLPLWITCRHTNYKLANLLIHEFANSLIRQFAKWRTVNTVGFEISKPDFFRFPPNKLHSSHHIPQ